MGNKNNQRIDWKTIIGVAIAILTAIAGAINSEEIKATFNNVQKGGVQ